MNKNIEEFILKLEPVLNERDEKLKKREELIKDVNDFLNLLPELDLVISDLEKSYLESNDPKVKAELDSYLKERIVYYDTIRAFTKEALDIKENLDSVSEEQRESEEKLLHLLYQRRELEKKIEYYENQEILVSNESQSDYENLLNNLDQIDQEILTNYQFLHEISGELDEEFSYEANDLLMPLSTPKETENLIKERENILASLKEIENSKGRKILYKDTYHGQAFSKKIPKQLRGKYGLLMGKLKKIEKTLNKEYLPNISIDGILYDGMSKNQKIQYLANLMLQIEVFADKSFMPCIVNGKKIPFEYKQVYEQLVDMIKDLESKKVHYYSYVIDQKYYNKLNLGEKLNYIDDLVRKVTNNFIDDPIEIVWNGKKFRIDKKDKELFWKLIEMFEAVKEECKKKVEELGEENNHILNFSNVTDLEKVSLNNQLISLPKEQLPQFLQNKAMIENIEAAEDKFEQVVFDSEYYGTLSEEEKINYCKNLINTIILKEKRNPVELYMDGKEVVVDAKYTKAFTRAVQSLIDIREKNQTLDIYIDEEYVATLADEEKLDYYYFLLHDISSKPIHDKMSLEVEGKVFYFDKKYALLFEVVMNRYLALRAKLTEALTVKKVEKPKKLEKIKKFLKKKAVQIALTVSALAASYGMGHFMARQNVSTQEVVSESTFTNENTDMSIDDIESIELDNSGSVSLDEENVAEVKDQTNLGNSFELNENPIIYENTDLNTPLSPTYQDDSYTIVSEHYQMPDGTLQTVNYTDSNAQEKIDQIKANGGVLQSVSGVAKSGEEDYLKNKIPTGVFDINDVQLQDVLADQELGGRSR